MVDVTCIAPTRAGGTDIEYDGMADGSNAPLVLPLQTRQS
jgi:hypothetical protein